MEDWDYWIPWRKISHTKYHKNYCTWFMLSYAILWEHFGQSGSYTLGLPQHIPKNAHNLCVSYCSLVLFIWLIFLRLAQASLEFIHSEFNTPSHFITKVTKWRSQGWNCLCCCMQFTVCVYEYIHILPSNFALKPKPIKTIISFRKCTLQ